MNPLLKEAPENKVPLRHDWAKKTAKSTNLLIVKWNQEKKGNLKWWKGGDLINSELNWTHCANFSSNLSGEILWSVGCSGKETHRDPKCNKQIKILQWFVVKIFAIESKWKRSRTEGKRKWDRVKKGSPPSQSVFTTDDYFILLNNN